VRPLGAHGRGSPGRHLPFWRKLRAHSSADPRKLYGRRAGGAVGVRRRRRRREQPA